jgi:hypothetical protein
VNKEGAAKETKEKRKEDAAEPHRGGIPRQTRTLVWAFKGSLMHTLATR